LQLALFTFEHNLKISCLYYTDNRGLQHKTEKSSEIQVFSISNGLHFQSTWVDPRFLVAFICWIFEHLVEMINVNNFFKRLQIFLRSYYEICLSYNGSYLCVYIMFLHHKIKHVFRSKRTLHVKLPFWASFIKMGMARITNIYLKFYFVMKKHNVQQILMMTKHFVSMPTLLITFSSL
jgi:hypothetical protein